jgi:PIN domain nuclease of toxin-antitoxin system
LRNTVSAVLDASALLAYVRREPGEEAVTRVLRDGACISAANWAEVLSKLSDLGHRPDDVAKQLTDGGVLGQLLVVHPFTESDARETARLRARTRSAQLSLADRACLALGRSLRLPVLTADRAWKKLHVGATIRVIR